MLLRITLCSSAETCRARFFGVSVFFLLLDFLSSVLSEELCFLDPLPEQDYQVFYYQIAWKRQNQAMEQVVGLEFPKNDKTCLNLSKDKPVSVGLLCSGLYLEELGARRHKFSVSSVD